jgi:hypothetical protein
MPMPTPKVETGFLLLADISGYTSFLEAVAASHPEMTRPGGELAPAYPVLSSLLDVVVESIAPTFRLAEIEGDAVFGYALGERLAGGAEGLLDIVRSAYDAFRARVEEVMVLHRHDCDACMTLPSLELKFVVHHGTVVIQSVAGREGLFGPAVNTAHRLLKNSVTEQEGRRAYLFVTETAARQLDPMLEIGVAHEERYADVGSVTGLVVPLKTRGTREARRPTPTSKGGSDGRQANP